MNVDAHVRVAQTHGRPFSHALAEVVGNGIFGAVGHKFGVVEVFGIDYGIDRKCFLGREVLFPFDPFHFLIYHVGVVRTKPGDRHQNA